MAHHVGDMPRLTGTFKTRAGVLTNPTAVTVVVTHPSGQNASYTATNESDGVYYVDIKFTAPGIWAVKFSGTGAVTASEPWQFSVLP